MMCDVNYIYFVKVGNCNYYYSIKDSAFCTRKRYSFDTNMNKLAFAVLIAMGCAAMLAVRYGNIGWLPNSAVTRAGIQFTALGLIFGLCILPVYWKDSLFRVCTKDEVKQLKTASTMTTVSSMIYSTSVVAWFLGIIVVVCMVIYVAFGAVVAGIIAITLAVLADTTFIYFPKKKLYKVRKALTRL